MNRAPLQNQHGFSLMQVMVALAISSMLTLTVLANLQTQKSVQQKTDIYFNLNSLARNTDTYVRNGSAWSATYDLAENTSFQCLRDGNCTEQSGGSFKLVDPKGITIVHDSTKEPAQGYRFDGTPCNTFSETGNNSCPFRVHLKWSPICTGNCQKPLLKISAEFEYKAENEIQNFRADSYNFEVIKDTAGFSSGTGGLVCMTGKMTPSGPGVLVNSSSNGKYSFNDVFLADPFDAVKNEQGGKEDNWGLRCIPKNGWIAVGCSAANMNLDDESGPADISDADLFFGANGCTSDDSEAKRADAEISLVCCKIE
jgi:type II secretory pathway pseudopilin PulG